MDERFARTQATSMEIKSFHYNLAEKWECDFDMERKENSEINEFIKSQRIFSFQPLNTRDTFFGSRTENIVKLYEANEDEKIK